MTRGYQIEDIKEKLLEVLHNSKTGVSGLEISERLNINRVTMTKYLKVFAAEGLLKQKNLVMLICGLSKMVRRSIIFLRTISKLKQNTLNFCLECKKTWFII